MNDDRLFGDAAWAHYEATLREIYGAARADLILDGKDPDHQRDIAAWQRLGRRRAA